MHFFFLTNGNSQIGLGHIKRCLILADEAKKQNISSCFLTTENSAKANEVIEENGYKLYALNVENSLPEDLLKIMKETACSLKIFLIIDSDDQKFRDLVFQEKLLEVGVQFMYIVLDNQGCFRSRYLLNQNILAPTLHYQTEEYTEKMLGSNYFVFDEAARSIESKINLKKKEKYNLFVAFGGADPLNLTSKIISCLDKTKNRVQKVYIIVGVLNPNLSEISKRAENSDLDIEVIFNTSKIYDYMSKSDLAICSMGLTYWELALHNIPCISISASRREEKVLNYLTEANYCLKLGYGNEFNSEEISEKLSDYFEGEYFLDLNLSHLQKEVNRNGAELIIKTILKNETSN